MTAASELPPSSPRSSAGPPPGAAPPRPGLDPAGLHAGVELSPAGVRSSAELAPRAPRSRLSMLDLFSGSGSASRAAAVRGWRVVRIDNGPGTTADLRADLRTWSPPITDPSDAWRFDLVWASPPCTQLSTANQKTRNVSEGLDCVHAAVRIIEALAPRWWVLENVHGATRAMASFSGRPSNGTAPSTCGASFRRLWPWCPATRRKRVGVVAPSAEPRFPGNLARSRHRVRSPRPRARHMNRRAHQATRFVIEGATVIVKQDGSILVRCDNCQCFRFAAEYMVTLLPGTSTLRLDGRCDHCRSYEGAAASRAAGSNARLPEIPPQAPILPEHGPAVAASAVSPDDQGDPSSRLPPTEAPAADLFERGRIVLPPDVEVGADAFSAPLAAAVDRGAQPAGTGGAGLPDSRGQGVSADRREGTKSPGGRAPRR